MSMDEVPVTKARADLADLVNRVAYGGERIALTRHGRTVAAIVSADDLQRLEDGPAPTGDARLSVVESRFDGPGEAQPRASAPAAAWSPPPGRDEPGRPPFG
jgi:prevent-host-death family protein